MQAHSLFEPLLSFDLTQVGASKTRRLASTHRAGNVEGSRRDGPPATINI